MIRTLESLVNQDFKTLTYTEAVRLLEKADNHFEFPVAWGGDIQAEHERYLCEKVFMGPVVLVDYRRISRHFI